MRTRICTSWLAAALLCTTVSSRALEPGDMAPDFLGHDPQGRTLSLAAHRGKPVVATFWASWCAPCLSEMAVLETIQRELGKALVEVIAINWGESRERYLGALDTLSASALTVTRDEDGRIGRSFGVQSIPRLFVIDKAGQVAFVHAGYSAEAAPRLVEQLDFLLARPAP